MAAPTLLSSGTQACTISSEHTLNNGSSITTAGYYQLDLDLNALANGDSLIVRIKYRVLSGGTTRLYREATYSHVQGEKIVSSLPILCMYELIFTITQTAGTGRSIPWRVLSL